MFEFLLFGILIGITEDIIAIKLTTGASITPRMIGIIVAIAIPFAIIGEMVADRVNLARTFKKISDFEVKQKDFQEKLPKRSVGTA